MFAPVMHGAFSTFLGVAMLAFSWQTELITDQESLAKFPRDPNLWDVDNSDIGYYILTDWTFDDEFHDELADLPPLPTHEQVTFDMLSEYSQYLHIKLGRINKRNAKNWRSNKKLIADLRPRVSQLQFRFS